MSQQVDGWRWSWVIDIFRISEYVIHETHNEYKLDLKRINNIWSWRRSKIDNLDRRRSVDMLSATRDITISNELILFIFQSELLDQIKTYCRSSNLSGSSSYSMMSMRTVAYEKDDVKSLILSFWKYIIDLAPRIFTRILKRDLFTLFFRSILYRLMILWFHRLMNNLNKYTNKFQDNTDISLILNISVSNISKFDIDCFFLDNLILVRVRWPKC